MGIGRAKVKIALPCLMYWMCTFASTTFYRFVKAIQIRSLEHTYFLILKN